MVCKFCGTEVRIGQECAYCGRIAEACYYPGMEKDSQKHGLKHRKERQKIPPGYCVVRGLLEKIPEKKFGSYTVKKADCLWNISKMCYGNPVFYYAIADANGIKDANLIYPGMLLHIPDIERRSYG